MIKSRQQRGMVLMIVVVVMMMIGFTFLIAKSGELLLSVGKQYSATNSALNNIQNALVNFTATYGRLPCPSDPMTNPGWSNGVANAIPPPPVLGVCSKQDGVVPWKVLGLTQLQVTDEWGRLISYRVYDGSFGLTQDQGASALNCDTNNLTTLEVPPTITGLCDNTGGKHDTLYPSFITYGPLPSFSKGLHLTDSGSPTPPLAFVLISHGPSGLGGYYPSGSNTFIQKPLPAPTAADFNNTQANPSFFVRMATSAADVPPGTLGHYDDVVSYISITDLLKQAHQDARDWPEDILPSFNPGTTANMTNPSTDAANPHFLTTNTLGQGFVQTAVGTDPVGTAVASGGVSGSYASCLWWPVNLRMVSGTARTIFMAAVDFAASDVTSGDRFPGFTLGFLSGSDPAGPPTNSTCGTSVANISIATNTAPMPWIPSTDITIPDTTGIAIGMNAYGANIPPNTKVIGLSGNVVSLNSLATGTVGGVYFADARLIRRNLGWEGGALASYVDRFAVEFDSIKDTGSAGPPAVPTANDPTTPHLSVDFSGVNHDGTSASACIPNGSGLPCDNSGISNFMLSGLAVFNTARVEVTPKDCVAPIGTGGFGNLTISVSSASGIQSGMSVFGVGIASGAKVVGVTGSTITLAAANSSGVSGTVTFGGSLTIPATVTATGTVGSSTITVSNPAGIEVGMPISGTGIATGAKVQSFAGSILTLTASNTGPVSGLMIFTPITNLTRNFIQSWTLSNDGCSSNTALCTVLKDTTTQFSMDVSANSEALHAVSCIPDTINANAYDSVYFGITTSNRDNTGVPTTNVIFKGLNVHNLLLP